MMSASVAVASFRQRSPWAKYSGATYAWAALRGEQLISLGCRIVFSPRPPSDTWTFAGSLEDLVVSRGWLPIRSVEALLDQLTAGQADFDGHVLVLARAQPASPYGWTATTHLPRARKPINWPALHLRGMGDRHEELMGYERFHNLGARLPFATPRAFSGWTNLGAFLGGDGEPFNFGDAFITVFDGYAPFYARFRHVKVTGDRLEVTVEADAFSPELLLARPGSEEPLRVTLQPGSEDTDPVWSATLQASDLTWPLELHLITEGQIVDEYVLEEPRRTERRRTAPTKAQPVPSVIKLTEPGVTAWVDAPLSEKLPTLRGQGEGQRLEYIDGFPDQARELAKEIAAFATSNTGTILLGVDDAGELVGLPNVDTAKARDQLLQRLEGVCTGTVKPAIQPTAKFGIEVGRVVLAVEVPKGREPLYYVEGKPYLRALTSSRPAEPHEVIEYVRHWLDETTATDAKRDEYASTLSETLIDIIIFADEVASRDTQPWFNDLRTRLKEDARSLRQLAATDVADTSEDAPRLFALATQIESAVTMELFLNSGWQEFEDLVSAAARQASAILDARQAQHPLTAADTKTSREALRACLRQLVDLTARLDSLMANGQPQAVQQEAAELGYRLVHLTFRPQAVPSPHQTTIRQIGRQLHLLETCRLLIDGGASARAILDTVRSAAERIQALLG